VITTDMNDYLTAQARGERLTQHEVTFTYVDAWTGEPAQLNGLVWAPATTTEADVPELVRVATETYAQGEHTVTEVARVTLAGRTVLTSAVAL
jgi:hypothetical protein